MAQFAGPAILELNTQRVQRWGAGVKEFLPKLWYIPGEEHTLVDTFSRLPRLEDELDQQAIELDNVYMLDTLNLLELPLGLP